jgi:hypothetical protein
MIHNPWIKLQRNRSNAMAFADPQSTTIGATTFSMPRTGSGLTSGSFATSDGNVTMEVSHDRRKRNRHLIKLSQTKTVTDPLIPANSAPTTISVHLVADVPPFGWTATEQLDAIKGLIGTLSASTYADAVKLLGNES